MSLMRRQQSWLHLYLDAVVYSCARASLGVSAARDAMRLLYARWQQLAEAVCTQRQGARSGCGCGDEGGVQRLREPRLLTDLRALHLLPSLAPLPASCWCLQAVARRRDHLSVSLGCSPRVSVSACLHLSRRAGRSSTHSRLALFWCGMRCVTASHSLPRRRSFRGCRLLSRIMSSPAPAFIPECPVIRPIVVADRTYRQIMIPKPAQATRAGSSTSQSTSSSSAQVVTPAADSSTPSSSASTSSSPAQSASVTAAAPAAAPSASLLSLVEEASDPSASPLTRFSVSAVVPLPVRPSLSPSTSSSQPLQQQPAAAIDRLQRKHNTIIQMPPDAQPQLQAGAMTLLSQQAD